MIIHLYLYRLKILLKNRSLIFWTCLFPLIIATVYFLIFYNASEDKELFNVPIAIQEVNETKSVGDYLSSIKSKEGISLFLVTYVSSAEGESLLLNDMVDAYISYDDNFNINSRESNNKSLLKTYLDIYLEKVEIKNEVKDTLLQEKEISGILQEKEVSGAFHDKTWNYVTYEAVTNSSKSLYFYAVIAFACILGSNWGFKEMMDFYGDGSFIGLKIQISTMEKKYLILSNITAIMTIHFSSVLILLFYLVEVLNVIVKRNTPIMILIVFLGSFVGITIGASIFMLLQTNKRVKRAVLNTFIIVGGILSGLFYPNVNYYIIKKVPMIHYLNPASLITNTFYNLLYKEDFYKVYINLSIILSWGILLGFLALSSLRRRNYASI